MIKSLRTAIGLLLGTTSVLSGAVDPARAVDLPVIAFSSLKTTPVLEPEQSAAFTPPKELLFVASEARLANGSAWCDGDLINPTDRVIEVLVRARNETSGPFVINVIKSKLGPMNLKANINSPTLRLEIPPRSKVRFNASAKLGTDYPKPGGKSLNLAWEFHYANGTNPSGHLSIGILKK